MNIWTSGIPGDAETAGHSAPAGAGEGEADASGAAEAHHPDESADACFPFALRPGERYVRQSPSLSETRF